MPQHSSMPPSMDIPMHGRLCRASPPGGNGEEEQGIPNTNENSFPPKECHELFPLRPTGCRRRSLDIMGCNLKPLRQQACEVPVFRSIATEDQHRLICVCVCTTCAALPENALQPTTGPRMISVAIFSRHSITSSSHGLGGSHGAYLEFPPVPCGWSGCQIR